MDCEGILYLHVIQLYLRVDYLYLHVGIHDSRVGDLYLLVGILYLCACVCGLHEKNEQNNVEGRKHEVKGQIESQQRWKVEATKTKDSQAHNFVSEFQHTKKEEMRWSNDERK